MQTIVRGFMATCLIGCSVGIAASSDPVADAQQLIGERKYYEAAHLLEPVLRDQPKNIPALMTSATAHVALGDATRATEELDRVEKLPPAPSGYHTLRGRVFLLQAEEAAKKKDEPSQQSFGVKAAGEFTLALAESPNQVSLLRLRAMAMRASGRVDEAMGAYKTWVAATPRDPDGYAAFAAMLAEAGRWKDTEALLAAAPQDDPALKLAIDLAVLENGLGRVPWGDVQPLFDSVQSRNTDAATATGLSAARGLLSANMRPTMLQVLQYVDANPEDTLKIAQTLFRYAPAGDPSPAGVTLPVLREHPQPVYPDVARRARIEGVVEVVALIRRDGSVGPVHVLGASNPTFVDPAVDAISRWLYVPASKDGQAIDFALNIHQGFRLKVRLP